MRITTLLLLTFVFGLAACRGGKNSESLDTTSSAQGQPPADNGGGELKPCYALSFPERTWPVGMTSAQREAFKLALDLTGSYEGTLGWTNLTGNFDGQGLSMGLLNQTLGTGSLQPLLAEMKNKNPAILVSLFPSAHLTSFVTMIEKWEKARAQGLTLSTAAEPYSPLDMEPSGVVNFAASAEGESVTWAAQNLYDGDDFKTDWRRELGALAGHASYVDLQIATGLTTHQRALEYQRRIGLGDLRTYLLMFDFVIQNGSIQSDVWEQYETWVAANPRATATEKLKQLLTFRLAKVKPQYVDDVRARKLAIIDGAAVVHGRPRQLETEYCVNRLTNLQ